jgi:hypothetical protein
MRESSQKLKLRRWNGLWETRGCPITYRASDFDIVGHLTTDRFSVVTLLWNLFRIFKERKSRHPLLRYNLFLFCFFIFFVICFFPGHFYLFILYYFLPFLIKVALRCRISDSYSRSWSWRKYVPPNRLEQFCDNNYEMKFLYCPLWLKIHNVLLVAMLSHLAFFTLLLWPVLKQRNNSAVYCDPKRWNWSHV